MSYNLSITYNDIMNIYSSTHKVGNKQDIKRAYEFAAQQHADMYRGSGEPYINHPLRVARLVTEWGFESDVIIASLLHDIVEDCNVPLSEIEELFGSNVSRIVDVVTALSDKDFIDHTPSKEQIDLMSDVRLQKKMDHRALYVKIADRIDNLNTITGVKEEKRIPKAEHTRDIIIPMVRMLRGYHFVFELEELCFEIEHSDRYYDIRKRYLQVCDENSRRCQESLDLLSNAFDPRYNIGDNDLEKYHRYIRDFTYSHRSYVSIFKQITQYANNIEADWTSLLSKDNTPLYDLTLVVSDDLSDENSILRPKDIFIKYFDKVLAPRGFYLIQYYQNDDILLNCFIISDEMDNLYRVYVRTETDQLRFTYGDVIDEDGVLSIVDINETDPRDTYIEKIKVFRKDGSALLIDKGATVLDFAFHIHGDLGYHFNYALIEKSKTQLPAYTRLNEGDQITIITDENIHPDISWFKYIKTSKAGQFLVRYFSNTDNLSILLDSLKAQTDNPA